MTVPNLVLSVFPGIDLFGMPFETAGAPTVDGARAAGQIGPLDRTSGLLV